MLRAFVEDLHERIGNFTMTLDRRVHLQKQLDDPFIKRTFTGGLPYTLQVEKTTGAYDAEVKKWQARVNCAKSQLGALISEAQLMNVIGEESCRGLLNHRVLQRHDSTPPTPLVPGSNNETRLNNIAGSSQSSRPQAATTVGAGEGSGASVPQKRPFIDLTED